MLVHGDIDPSALETLERVTAGHRTLEDVVRHWLAQRRAVSEVVTQDEFTHDVIIQAADDVHLVYDTT